MKTIIIDGVEYNLTPKVVFHKGDWIVHHGTENIYQVVAVIDNQYQLKYGDNYTVQNCADVDRCARLYDVAKDAKDGDVLFCKGELKYSNGIKYERICLFNNLNNAFFTLTKTSNFVEEYDIDVNIDYPDNTVPATKEQKEILFMAMKDAGYEFDFEKKELKKIEQKPLSEEDKAHIDSLLKRLEGMCKPDATFTSTEFAISEDEDWLKSLRDRVKQQSQWKPSEEQMVAFETAIKPFCEAYRFKETPLGILYNDLKKLREE